MQDVPEETVEIEQTVPEEEGGNGEATIEEKPAEIEIGDRSFKTEAEALAYAREQMLIDSAKADAFPQAPPTPEDNTAWEQEFYANPKEAIAKAMATAAAEGEKRALSKVSMQSEDVRIWNKFTELNPDLADFKEDVEQTANKYKEIIVTLTQTKGEDEAIKFIAHTYRKRLRQECYKI